MEDEEQRRAEDEEQGKGSSWGAMARGAPLQVAHMGASPASTGELDLDRHDAGEVVR
jgi:hypothetical protein